MPANINHDGRIGDLVLTGFTLLYLSMASSPSVAQSITVSAPSQSPIQVSSIDRFVLRPSDAREMSAHQPQPSHNADVHLQSDCRAASEDEYIALLQATAKQSGMPPLIAQAVTHIESRFHFEKIGKAGEVGLMQIRPETAAMLGFHGSYIELADPATNIKYGVSYLAGAWRLAHGNLCRALMKYRAGHQAERMSPLSSKYCRLAKDYLRQMSAPQSAAIPSDSVSMIYSR